MPHINPGQKERGRFFKFMIYSRRCLEQMRAPQPPPPLGRRESRVLSTDLIYCIPRAEQIRRAALCLDVAYLRISRIVRFTRKSILRG